MSTRGVKKGNKNMRDLAKILARLDQALNPKLGPRPVKKLKDVTYVHLGSSDEDLSPPSGLDGMGNSAT